MKKILFVICVLFFIFLAYNINAQNRIEVMSVYIGGSYQALPGFNQQRGACYWVNGYMTRLDGVSVQAITTYRGRVYAAGIYSQDGNRRIFCYWVNGMPYPLPGCTSVDKIIVYNNDVYISGSVGIESGFWINGIRQNMFNDGRIADFKIIDGVIYAAGSYMIDDIFYACYWIDDIRIELQNSQNFIAYGIEVVNNQVYIGAWGTVTNLNGSCYWINGEQKLNSDVERFTLVNKAFVIHNENVIMLGNEHYWVNGERHNYRATGFDGDVFTYVNGVIYIAGTFTGLGGNNVCYWIDAERRNMFSLRDTGNYFILTSIHVAPIMLPE